MQEKKVTVAVAEAYAERKKHLEELQVKEGERKRAEYKASIPGQRAILNETKEKISSIARAAADRRWSSASWTDRRGGRQIFSGPGILGLDPDVAVLPDLIVEDNFAAISAIERACQRSIETVKALLDLLREAPDAMPAELDKYMARLVAEIPPLDSIEFEVTTNTEPAKTAKPETSGK